MECWKIKYCDRECVAVEISFIIGDTPALTLATGEKEFQIEFKNRSDYMAARDSSVAVDVKVINADRSKYWLGVAVKQK
jgi:hypothetical protein